MPKETEPTVPGSGREAGRQVVKPDDVTATTGPGAAEEPKPDMGATQLLGDAGSPALANVLHRGKKYEIGKLVARGGMGAILDAKETIIERTVAMKIVLDISSPDALARFVTEGKITGQLEHPNIVPVHELGVDEQQQVFYTMKFVRGVTLRKVLQQLAESDAETITRYPLSHLLTIFQKVCDAVAFAHSKGVIHRDLKPENIMLGDFGEVLVMDWGLAKVLGRHAPTAPEQRTLVSTKSLQEMGSEGTMAGTIMGTPQYMPPEQAHGRIEQLDARSDIYSLGAILYHILTLEPSVTDDDATQVLFKVCNGEIVPPAEAVAAVYDRRSSSSQETGGGQRPPLQHLPGGRVPESLSAVTMKAMALKQEDRYQSVPELQREIEAYQNGFATSAEHAGLLKQLTLLVKRHKREFAISFAALFILLGFSAWFVVNLRASERAARAAEAVAVEKEEETRQALAQAQIALAEAAYREGDAPAMQTALNAVPDDLRDSNWNYLLEKSDTSIATLRGKQTRIIAHAVPHPKQPGVFAIISFDGLVELVVARTGARLMEFKADFKQKKHNNSRLAFSPDGERLAIGLGDSGIAIHGLRDGKKLVEWESAAPRELQFSPDGRLLLSRVEQNYINLWDSATGQLLWNTQKTQQKIFAVFDPSGQFMLASLSKKLRLLNPKDGSQLREVADLREGANTVAIRPDGRRALVHTGSGFVRCVDLKDGRILFDTRVASGGVSAMAYTPDGSRFVARTDTSGGQRSLSILDAESGVLLFPLLGGRVGYDFRFFNAWISIHPLSGELLVDGRPTKVWETADSQREKSLVPNYVATQSIRFWKTDDWVFVGGGQFTDKLSLVDLHLKEPQKYPVWRSDAGKSRRVSISADGRFAAVCSELPIAVQFLRLNGRNVEQVRAFKSEGGGVGPFALSPAGDRLWLNEKVMDPATGVELLRMDRLGISRFNSACWLNRTQVVTTVIAKALRGQSESEEQLILWDTTTGQRLRTVTHPSYIHAVAVMPDGKTFAEAGADRMVRLRDAATLEVQEEFRAHDEPIMALACHPNRRILATASTDLTIKLWDLDSGRQLDEFRGHTGLIRDVAFSPSGRRLASLSGVDRTTRIWEPESLNPDAAKPKVSADGWEDLLAQLKRNDVAKTGNGWQLNNGVLFSPNKRWATIALPGEFAQCSYQVRVKLRQLVSKDSIDVVLPVVGRRASFMLDGYPKGGFFSCLREINGERPESAPGTVKGKVVKDSETHELELTVRLEGVNVRFEARLDDQPLYQWSGPVSELRLVKEWQTAPPGVIALGTHSADWLVYAVKVKRLEGKP